jgi:hypothetical protein
MGFLLSLPSLGLGFYLRWRCWPHYARATYQYQNQSLGNQNNGNSSNDKNDTKFKKRRSQYRRTSL